MVRVLYATGYGVCRYGYGVGKPDPWYTCVQPFWSFDSAESQAFGSIPAAFQMRSARVVEFTEGLRAGCQRVEKELMDLQKYVGQLEGQLHKEGNW